MEKTLIIIQIACIWKIYWSQRHSTRTNEFTPVFEYFKLLIIKIVKY